MTAHTPFCPDTEPPASITELTYDNTTVCEQITWSWVNPGDPDLDGKMIYANGAFVHNATAGSTNSVWGTLVGGVEYEFASHTFDNATPANVNMTWINGTAIAKACPTPPVAEFHADNTTPVVDQDVHFTDDSTNSPHTWAWTFGDGNSSILQNPTHAYGYAGTFTVSLTATNDDGNDDEVKVDYIVVSNAPDTPVLPVSAFSANETAICMGDPVLFTNESSGYPDTYNWYFWDNESLSSAEINPVYVFYTAGSYSIRLFTSNANGTDFENKTNYIVVTDCTPIVSGLVPNFTSNVTCGNIPFNVQFNDTSTGTNITTYYWDFGDGNTSELMNGNNTYTEAGLYSVMHSITNDTAVTAWMNRTDYIRAVPAWATCPGNVTPGYSGDDGSGVAAGAMFGIVGGIGAGLFAIRLKRKGDDDR
jgi:PKD repeat protein